MHDWLAMSRMRIKESTYSRYVHLSETHILPRLGGLTLDQLTTQTIERHISFLLSEGRVDGSGGLAPKTASDILTIIKGSIDYARCSGYQINCYLDRLTIKKPQIDMRVLSAEEQQKLLAVLLYATDLPKLGVLLCLYTGMRIGEVCALRWENIDFSEGVLSVRETLQRIQDTDDNNCRKTKIVITEPKSKNSIRVIPLPVSLTDIVCQFKSAPKAYLLTGRTDKFMEPRTLQYRFEKYISESGLANSEGGPLSYTQFKRVWQYIVTRSTKERTYVRYINGQKITKTVTPVLGEKAAHNGNVVYSLDFQVTPHQLRHTYITNLIYASVDPKTVQYLAGHENSKITMDIYAKVKYNKPEQLSAVVNTAFGQPA